MMTITSTAESFKRKTTVCVSMLHKKTNYNPSRNPDVSALMYHLVDAAFNPPDAQEIKEYYVNKAAWLGK